MVVHYKNKNWNYYQQKEWDINFSCYLNAARDNLLQIAKQTPIQPLYQCPLAIVQCKSIYDVHQQIKNTTQRRMFQRYLENEITQFKQKPIFFRAIYQLFNVNQINYKKNLRVFFISFDKLSNLEVEFQQTLGPDYPSHPIDSYRSAQSLFKCQKQNSIIEQGFAMRHTKLQTIFEGHRSQLSQASKKAHTKLSVLKLDRLSFKQYEQKVNQIKQEFSDYYQYLISVRPAHVMQEIIPTALPKEEQLFYQKVIKDDYVEAITSISDAINKKNEEFDVILRDQLKHDKAVVERFVSEKTKLLQENPDSKIYNHVMQGLRQQLEGFHEVLAKMYEDSKYEEEFNHFLKKERQVVNEKTLHQLMAERNKQQADYEYLNVVKMISDHELQHSSCVVA